MDSPDSAIFNHAKLPPASGGITSVSVVVGTNKEKVIQSLKPRFLLLCMCSMVAVHAEDSGQELKRSGDFHKRTCERTYSGI